MVILAFWTIRRPATQAWAPAPSLTGDVRGSGVPLAVPLPRRHEPQDGVINGLGTQLFIAALLAGRVHDLGDEPVGRDLEDVVAV